MLSRLTLSRPILSLALIVLAAAVPASTASAEDRCTGTLCDLYYGGPPAPEPAKPAKPATTAAATANGQIPEGATPLMVPRFFAPRQAAADGQTAAAAGPDTSRVRVEGGGLIGMMNGTAPERCTGTLCDLFYGGPPPEKPAAPPAGATALASGAATEPGEPPPPMVDNVRRAPPACAAKGRDPWSCYR